MVRLLDAFIVGDFTDIAWYLCTCSLLSPVYLSLLFLYFVYDIYIIIIIIIF